ncbi:MAG: phenylacetate-CoA oxygenase subunit PaaC [Flavobacteriaceae bacterium]|nr:phenylacetate-CoA oxygenase subunit PaaC [Flavobacteriaceae bacterium]
MKNLFKYTVRLADNSLILGHRLAENCSWGPYLEEDISVTNTSLDLLGQAEEFLIYAAEVENEGRTADDLAYKRPEIEYYNVQLTEQPNDDFAHIQARQFFMDAFNFYLYSALKNSSDSTIAAISAKSLKEVTYHLRRSSEWLIRLGKGTPESKERMQKAVNDLWQFTSELFEMDEVDEALISEGIAIDLKEIQKLWKNKITEIFKMADLTYPEGGYQATGSRKGYHTEYLGFILAEMQYLPRAYPTAKW